MDCAVYPIDVLRFFFAIVMNSPKIHVIEDNAESRDVFESRTYV